MAVAWSYEPSHVADSTHFGWKRMELVWLHLGSTVPTLEVQDPVGMDVAVPGHLVEASVGKDPARDKPLEEYRTGSSVDHLVVLPDD